MSNKRAAEWTKRKTARTANSTTAVLRCRQQSNTRQGAVAGATDQRRLALPPRIRVPAHAGSRRRTRVLPRGLERGFRSRPRRPYGVYRSVLSFHHACSVPWALGRSRWVDRALVELSPSPDFSTGYSGPAVCLSTNPPHERCRSASAGDVRRKAVQIPLARLICAGKTCLRNGRGQDRRRGNANRRRQSVILGFSKLSPRCPRRDQGGRFRPEPLIRRSLG